MRLRTFVMGGSCLLLFNIEGVEEFEFKKKNEFKEEEEDLLYSIS